MLNVCIAARSHVESQGPNAAVGCEDGCLWSTLLPAAMGQGASFAVVPWLQTHR